MSAESNDVSYLTLLLSAEGVSELSNGKKVVFLRKDDIQRIELTSGSGSENPALQLAFGLILAVIGAFGLIPLLSGNIVMFRYESGFTFFGAIGAWLIWETLRKRTYLLVFTRSDKRKLFFHGRIESNEMSDFVQKAEIKLGYRINSKF